MARFQPGICPNPGGRPKCPAEVKELARMYAPAVIHALAEIALDVSERGHVRIAAAEALLNRGLGKPEQSENNQYIDRPIALLSTAEIQQILLEGNKPPINDVIDIQAPSEGTNTLSIFHNP